MRRFVLLAFGILFLAGCIIPPPSLPPAKEASASPRPLIWVDLDLMRLTVYEGNTEIARFPIAAGARDSPTPTGIYTINRRFVTEPSGFGTRFMGLNVPFGDYGIHGTNKPASIGGHFSHGCIRMYLQDAERLFSLTRWGTRVVITGGTYGPFTGGIRTLSPGDRGSDVMEMQKRLINHGFLQGWPDGIYGENTKKAVLAARRHFGLPEKDTADYTLLTRLGIMQFE